MAGVWLIDFLTGYMIGQPTEGNGHTRCFHLHSYEHLAKVLAAGLEFGFCRVMPSTPSGRTRRTCACPGRLDPVTRSEVQTMTSLPATALTRRGQDLILR